MEEYLKLFEKLLTISQLDFCKVEMVRLENRVFYDIYITFVSGIHEYKGHITVRFDDNENDMSDLHESLDAIIENGSRLCSTTFFTEKD